MAPVTACVLALLDGTSNVHIGMPFNIPEICSNCRKATDNIGDIEQSRNSKCKQTGLVAASNFTDKKVRIFAVII